MATSITGVMDGIATALKTISGLRVTAYLADQINPPQAVVPVPEIPEYHAAMANGLMDITAEIHLFLSDKLDRSGQRNLASYVDPSGANSVIAAIEADRKLGGAVTDCIVKGFKPQGLVELGSARYYMGVFTLQIVAPGS